MPRPLLHAVAQWKPVLAVSVLLGAISFGGGGHADDQLGQEVILDAPQSKEPAFLSKLTQDQETVKGQRGKYERIKDAEKEVIEYVTPNGTPGYQVIWDDAEGKHSIGYGPEAKDRTFFIPTPVYEASSTQATTTP